MLYNATEIIKLIGLSVSDEKVIALIKDKQVIDEEGIISIEFDEIGLELGLDDLLITDKQKSEFIGGLYLNDISFYHADFFPFNIKSEDNLKEVEKKINLEANYVDIEEPEGVYWIYEELGFFTIQFTNEKYEAVDSIYIRPFENPEADDFKEIIKLIEK